MTPSAEISSVLTESESNNPDDWVKLKTKTIQSLELKAKIQKQTEIMKKFRKRLVAKEVARRRLLKRKVPNRVSRTLLKLPDIARDIESFARENRVGADSWRRTGVSTFSGNVKLCASRSTLKRNMVSIVDMICCSTVLR